MEPDKTVLISEQISRQEPCARCAEQAAETERLTKERDTAALAAKVPLQLVIESQQEQLAALAEQNAKMRVALRKRVNQSAWKECGRWFVTYVEKEHPNGIDVEVSEQADALEALAMPDQSASVINRIKAQGMVEAADYSEELAADGVGPNLTVKAIRARAAELEGK